MTKSKKKSGTKPRGNKRAMRGTGDYSPAVLALPPGAARLEAKIDHLEKSLVNKTPGIKGAASTIGRTLGNFVNQGDLGALAAETMAKYFGHGDYNVKGNSLMKAVMSEGASGPVVAKFAPDGKRGTRITEREFLGDVFAGALAAGSTVFDNTSFPIVPTDRGTFPWLSGVAALFDQWEPHGIIFEFVSTSSEFNGTNQALGTVILATDYNSLDAAYASKQVMENSDFACSTKPSCSLMHGVECDKSERPLPVLYTTVQAANQNFSQLGNFQVATVGCSAAGVRLGELWVSYDITFYKKQLNSPASELFFLTASGTAIVGSGLLTAPVILSGAVAGGITITQVGATSVINLPPILGQGRFAILYYLTAFNAADSFAVTLVNCTQISNQAIAAAPSPGMFVRVIEITAPVATVALGAKFVANSAYVFACTEVDPAFAFV